LLYLAVAGHFYAAAWAEHNALLLLFSASVLFFIIGNQISKFERMNNPWILFILNALAVIPFIIGSHSLLLCIAGSMIFNFTLAPITRPPILSHCKSKVQNRYCGVSHRIYSNSERRRHQLFRRKTHGYRYGV
jgi:hypothetical protein